MLQLKSTAEIDNPNEPRLETESMCEPLSVCANGLKLALGLGRVRWESSAQHAKENTFPVHGLVGNKGNKKNTRIVEA